MGQEQRSRVMHRIAQMGYTKETQHIRLAPRGSAAREGRYPQSERREHRTLREQVQRWISWVLKAGYEEEQVTIDNGWVTLAGLVEAMARSKKRFGEFDEASLGTFLTANDAEGRFEVLDGRV